MGGFFKSDDSCLQKNEAACTYYRLEIPSFSDLSSEGCTTIEETTNDIYNIIKVDVKENLDLSELDLSCIDYEEEEAGKPTVKEFAIKIDKEVCELKDKQVSFETNLCEASIENCNIDLKSIVDSCDIQPTTQQELFQALIDEIQILKDKVAILEQN